MDWIDLIRFVAQALRDAGHSEDALQLLDGLGDEESMVFAWDLCDELRKSA